MTSYLLAYHGGGMAETPEEQEMVMNDWFGTVGEAMKDPGMPITQIKTIGSNGGVSDGGGANPVSGYSIVEADSIDAAIEHAKGCPVVASGGAVEVAEVNMPG